jgi:hypothetical protein
VRKGMLRRGVQGAQPPLQRRGLIERAAAAWCEARIGGANAGSGEPYHGLRTLVAAPLASAFQQPRGANSLRPEPGERLRRRYGRVRLGMFPNPASVFSDIASAIF